MVKLLTLCLVLLLPASGMAEEQAVGVTPTKNPVVIMRTSEGDISIELFAEKSPVTVANFLAYVDAGFYNGTIFHRVIPNFMIQGGGFNEALQQKKTNDPIINESKNRVHNTRGTIAMARTNDPNSATAQFFINQRSNLQLDWAPGREGYTVFGEVLDGMEIVDFIATADTGQAGGMRDVPKEPVVITTIVRQQPQ
ncbi:MAG: peptidylprolyl isomerase [Halioglobus sp.]|nr:peptidylprolyl isomerase [Halioglobus sp.]